MSDSEELELYEQDDIGLESEDSRDEQRGVHRFGRLADDSDGEASQASGAEDDVPEEVADEDYRILRATVVDIVSALGGLEDVLVDGVVETHYAIGDDVLRCLRDLRTLWRQDEDDASRLIPRIYAEVNVLEKGLVPLLLKAVGLGERGTKIALACTDLITSLTWPIDALAELRAAMEQNEDNAQLSRLAKLTVLERALVSYKAAILRARSGETHGSEHDVLQTVMLHILLPSLSKPRPLRAERDTGTISMCLHLFRNLLAIKDPLASSLSSNETIAASRLQSDLVVALDKAHILDTLLMLASSSETRELEPWNAVAAECVYQIFSGTKAALLVPSADQAPAAPSGEASGGAPAAPQRRPRPASASALASSLNAEASQRRAALMQNGATRHSRFGTALTFTGTDGRRRVSRTQAALRKTSEQLTEEAAAKQKRRFTRRKAIREKGAARLKTDWTREARAVLTRWSAEFLRVGFEPLTRSVLRDVRKENAKVGNVDEARVRIMQLAVFFLDYFLLQRAASAQKVSAARKAQQEQAKAAEARRAEKGKGRAIDAPEQAAAPVDGAAAAQASTVAADPALPEAQTEAAKNEWTFALVGFWLEPWAFKMATIRSEFALEAREWLEYVTAVQLWTVLLRLVDSMAHSGDAQQQDVAEGLQAQLYYEKNTLDMCQRIARSYKSQSFSCLEAVISFAHTMPRMLERYSSNKEHLFVRARARVKRAKARAGADGADLAEMQQDANERAEATYQERRFEFTRFQTELCKPEVADASLNFLARWRDFSLPAEQLPSVVGIMHRIAIKAGRADLFFPHDVRQTLRALLASPMVSALEPAAPTAARDAKKLIEYILKRYEKLTPEQQTKYAMGKGRTREVKPKKMPREIHVSPTRGHVGDVGIAVGLLAEMGKVRNIMWVKEALELASAERTEIVLSTDGAAARARSEERDEYDSDRRREPQSALDSNHLPSDEAVAKFTTFIMSYPNAEVATDGCMMPELKMLCRLVGLESESMGEDKMRWFVPAEVPPAHLDAEVASIEEFLRSPYDTEGAALRSFVRVVPKARAKKTPAEKDADEEDGSGYDTYGSGVVSDNDDGTGGQNAGRSRKEAAAELRKSRKRNRGGAAPRPRKKKAGPTWTAGDFIEDSDEEMAQAQAIIDARANAALAAEANASRANAAAADSDSDLSSSASARRRARGPARPRPTALARLDGTHVSPARSTPSRAGSTPPTSSPARGDSPAPAKSGRKLRPSGGLFFGGMDSDEEDAAMSDAEAPRAESPSPVERSATQLMKRPAMIESDDELSAREESAPATTQLAKRRRAAVLDSDDE